MLRRVALAVFVVLAAGAACIGSSDASEWRITGWTMYGGVGPYTGSEPPVGEGELAVYADLLGLSADQVEVLGLLHGDYVRSYRSAWVRWSEETSDLDARRRAERVGSSAGRVMGSIDRERAAVDGAFAERAEAALAAFHEDVRLLLEPGQESGWRRVELYLDRAAFFGGVLGYGRGRAPEGLADALELLRRAREDVGGESGPADLSGGAAAVVRSYETRLGGLIADFERRRGVLEEALDRYQSGRGEGDGEAESAAVRAALSLRGARRRLFEATARFEREVTASLRPELAAAFRSRVAEASADGSGPALLSGGGDDLTRFERMVRRLEGGRVGLSASQRRAVEGIDAERAEAREGVLRSFAPVVERWRAERAAEEAEDGGGGEGSSFEVRFTNGAIRLERVGAGGSSAGDRSEEDAEEGVDRDERRRLAVRLYEIEQEAVDALRALLSEEQRSAIVE